MLDQHIYTIFLFYPESCCCFGYHFDKSISLRILIYSITYGPPSFSFTESLKHTVHLKGGRQYFVMIFSQHQRSTHTSHHEMKSFINVINLSMCNIIAFFLLHCNLNVDGKCLGKFSLLPIHETVIRICFNLYISVTYIFFQALTTTIRSKVL